MPEATPQPDPPRFVMCTLASKSPRRAKLLSDAGYIWAFSAMDPPFDDPARPDQTPDPEGFAVDTALAKAVSAHTVLDEDVRQFRRETGRTDEPLDKFDRFLVLAADTVCVDDAGVLLGKPGSVDEVRDMLHRFVGKTHRVVTGVAITHNDPDHRQWWADTAEVTWGHIDPGEIDRYAQTGLWRGKAGGYNLEDRLGAGWPITVAGDPTTVVGLPMRRLIPVLRQLGVASDDHFTPAHISLVRRKPPPRGRFLSDRFDQPSDPEVEP